MIDVSEAARLTHAAMALLRRGDGRGAQPLLARAVERGGKDAPWMLLAQACLLSGDRGGEAAALDRVLAIDPRSLRGLLMRGDWHARGDDARLAGRFYESALRIAPNAGQITPDLIEGLKRAENLIAAQTRAYEAHLRERLSAGGHGASHLHPRVAEAIDILAGRAQPYFQAPTSFFYPGLPQITFYDRDAFAWLDAIEAASPSIRAELEAIEAHAFAPYVVADPSLPPGEHPLLDDPSWSALHLVQNGIDQPAAARCPRTMALLANAPQPRVRGRGPNVMFSQLRAHTHIRAHSGLTNTRLIVHVPLIVPPGSRLRVGNHVRAFEEGRAWVFDDSIEHEAWNDGDAPRTILLFDVWRPELGAEERAAVTALFEAIKDYGVETPNLG